MPSGSSSPRGSAANAARKPVASAGEEQIGDDAGQLDADTIRNLMRLALGGAFEGSAEVARRLERWQSQAGQAVEQVGDSSSDETDLDRLRFALVGLLFETPDVVERGARSLGSATRTSTGVMSRFVSPLASSRAARPFVRRYDAFVDDRLSALDRWIAAGRTEERSSRAMVREFTDEEVNAVIEYLADKPEVRDLIQEQSLGMAGEAVGELRGRTAKADRLLDRLVSSSLRREPSEVEPAPPPRRPAPARRSATDRDSG